MLIVVLKKKEKKRKDSRGAPIKALMFLVINNKKGLPYDQNTSRWVTKDKQ